MKDYTIRLLEKNEFHLLIPLMKDCFGLSVNTDYFEWKFIHNPAGFVLGFIAESIEGEVAAYYGVIPEKYYIDGKLTTIYQSCDTMTHSRHRKKGLFQRLALHCYEQLRQKNELFIIGFGGHQSTPGFLKFGWRQLFFMRNYFTPRIRSFVQLTQPKGVKELEDATSIEPLLQKSNSGVRIYALKDMTTYSWRISNPNYRYRLIGTTTSEGAEIDSYLCYYEYMNKFILFDFYFASSRSGQKLMNYLCYKMRSAVNVKGIVAFVQEESAQAKQLKKTGMLWNPFSKGPLSYRTPFILYSTEAIMNDLENPTSWNITSFEHDAL